ncbi:Non-structural maintenance of chromosomes element 4 A [Mactra antiquata]
MKAQALHTDFIKFQATDFASKIIKFAGGDSASETTGVRISPLGWSRFGKALQSSFKQTPIFQFMLGSFERGPKPVKVKQQRAPKDKDNTVGKETVPQQLKDFKNNDQSEATTEEVERVHQIIKDLFDGPGEGQYPLNYFEIVLNPDSFGHTIENIFHVSFLIRDGVVQMEMDPDGLPTIRPIDPTEKQKVRKNGQPQVNQQTAITLTQDDWRELVRVFKIEMPLITPLNSEQNG